MCDECVDVVNVAREFVTENTTEAEIKVSLLSLSSSKVSLEAFSSPSKMFLEKICNLFPASADGLVSEKLLCGIANSPLILHIFLKCEEVIMTSSTGILNAFVSGVTLLVHSFLGETALTR